LFDSSDGVPQSVPLLKVGPVVPPLAKAIQYDDVATVSSLLTDEPTRVEGDSYQDLTPLMMVCQTKNLTILNMLLNAGANVRIA